MILSELKSCVEELSDTLEEVEGYVHPCGGPGWRQVVHLDMNDPNQQCPDPWTESGGPLDIRFCVLLTASFPVAESYTQVCGKVHAYPSTSGAFAVLFSSPPPSTVAEYRVLVPGVVISSGDEHIWTFVNGVQPPDTFATDPIDTRHCPCLIDEHAFFIAATCIFHCSWSKPPRPGSDYFCESRPTPAYFSGATVSPGEFVLRDGLHCDLGSQC